MAKRILENVTIYFIKTQKGNIKGDSVYLNKEHAERIAYDFNTYYGHDVYIDSIIVPFVGQHLSYVDIYKGFDYGINHMYDVCYKSELYPSVEIAKQNTRWQQIQQQAIEKPEEFNVYQNRICSKDILDHDWYYGDVMEGKVNAEIKKLRVLRN